MNAADWNAQYMCTPAPRNLLLADALPCPFCNSKHLEISRTGAYVHCSNCGADGPEHSRLRHAEERMYAAIRSWNKRLTPAQL